MVMMEAGWGGVRLRHPEAAVESAQVRGIGGMSYSSGTSGEKNEEMSKKCSFIKTSWPLLTNCMDTAMRQQLSHLLSFPGNV